MRILLSALVAASFGALVASAPAATLFTSSAHTTLVTPGATAILTSSGFTITSGTAVIDNCADSRLTLSVTQNNSVAFTSLITSGTFSGCSPFPITGTFAWAPTMHGGSTFTLLKLRRDYFTTVDNVRWHLGGGLYSGNLTTNVAFSEPDPGGAGTAPITLELSDAGSVSGPLTGNGHIDAAYTFTGASSAWSFN